MTVVVVRGDITARAVEAIVNSANPSLLAGAGVCGAIHAAAGPDLEAACRRIGRCDVGSAVITPAFRLPAAFVIHAVGPRWLGGARGEPELLEQCHESIFRIAAQHGVSTLALPAISTGIYRYPLEAAAEIGIRVARRNDTAGRRTEFVCLDEATFRAYRREAGGA